MTRELLLAGCTPTVLAGYLKALGTHRIVSEQLDGGARSRWDADGRFFLATTAGADALLSFFLNEYAPTPLVTPWNGGSGFYPKDQQAGLQAIASSTDRRFAPYRETLARCWEALAALGLKERPKGDTKLALLRRLRATLPDEAVVWLDAAVVIGDDARYPALLGSGGNDGRLDFANNFMQRLAELLLSPPRRGRRGGSDEDPAGPLRAALFGEVRSGALQKAAVGQFQPALAGGTNMTQGIEAEFRVNPWDFVLMMEGALCFASAAVRRLETGRHGSAAFPFHLRASAVGFGASADADADSARGELWLPLWSRPAPFPELARLFAEGRLEAGRERAVSGLDAARAVASLGIDRGIDRFERFGLLRRNGLAYLAASLGTFHVPERRLRAADLLDQLTDLVRGVRDLDRPTSAIGAARRRLEEAMFEACRPAHGDQLTEVLAATGALLRALARSAKARSNELWPLQPLDAAWYRACDDGSPEFAIAAALASWEVREMLEPVERQGTRWRYTEARPLWTDRDEVENILALGTRRLQTAGPGDLPLAGRSAIGMSHLTALLQGRRGLLDYRRLGDLVFALAAVAPPATLQPRPRQDCAATADRVFCLLRAPFSPSFLAAGGRHPAPRGALAILGRLRAGDLHGALELAERYLRASGRRPRSHGLRPAPGRDLTALGAALVLPLPRPLETDLIHLVVHPAEPGAEADTPTETETTHA